MNSRPANPVVHLELHTGDLAGALAFYGGLFGWRPERIHAGAGSYLALGMGDRVGGGVVECEAEPPLWLPYVQVADLSRTTARAEALGGDVLLAPREGPAGWRSVVATPGGGEVAFFQAKNGGADSPLVDWPSRRANLGPARELALRDGAFVNTVAERPGASAQRVGGRNLRDNGPRRSLNARLDHAQRIRRRRPGGRSAQGRSRDAVSALRAALVGGVDAGRRRVRGCSGALRRRSGRRRVPGRLPDREVAFARQPLRLRRPAVVLRRAGGPAPPRAPLRDRPCHHPAGAVHRRRRRGPGCVRGDHLRARRAARRHRGEDRPPGRRGDRPRGHPRDAHPETR